MSLIRSSSGRRRTAAWLATAALAISSQPSHGADSTTIVEFSLGRSYMTSAGVYSPAGNLLRTLWSGRKFDAGTHQSVWDGKDDAGNPVALPNISARLVVHNLEYRWDGVIGNTSASFTGSGVHRSMFPPMSIAIAGDRAYYAVGYNEGQTGTHGFALQNPQIDLRPLNQPDPFSAWSLVASDGQKIYWANAGRSVPTSFVAASSMAAGTFAPFPAGSDVCLEYNGPNCYPPQRYAGVVDVASDKLQAPTGLAVQKAGSLLAVAHGRQGLVKLFNKTTGAYLRSFSIPVSESTNQIAAAPNGDLWVISGGSVVRHTGLESTPTKAATIANLSHPLAVAVDPNNDDIVLVADGGASQQVKAFDRTGRPLWSYGKPGGYASDPEAAMDKLWFRFDAGLERSALAVAPDGSFWVVDTSNNRMLHISRNRAYIEQIAYLPASYVATVDPNSPRRVFANYLEFDVEPTGNLQTGPRGWSLRRNWLAALPASALSAEARNGGSTGLHTVVTLPNNRTYAVTSVAGAQTLVELPAQGPARLVRSLATSVSGDTAQVLYANGELGFAHTGSNQSVYRLKLQGFSPAGDPQWESPPALIASIFSSRDTPTYKGAFSGATAPRFPVTESGKVIFFDQSVDGSGAHQMHLGAVNVGGREWAWNASPAGSIDEPGAFQTKSIDHTVHYGGNMVWAAGRHVLFGYHGEGFTDPKNGGVGQANQFLHFYDNGLYLGQFGTPTTRAADATAGAAGNAFSNILIARGPDTLLLFHNDESQHGGVHRWTIGNIGSLREFAASGPMGGTIRLSP